jgi:hypothetical protein
MIVVGKNSSSFACVENKNLCIFVFKSVTDDETVEAIPEWRRGDKGE